MNRARLKKFLIRGAIGLVALVAVLTVVVAAQPNEYHIERSTHIAASPAAIFPKVNDLQAWDDWSPWKELDPNPKSTLSTPSSGKGATFTWDGNENVGAGTLTVLDSRPNERVEVEQEFVRPMPGKAVMTFRLQPDEAGTNLTWALDGRHDFVSKAVCLVMNMDATIGPHFERGLANIKQLAEKK